MPSGGFNPTALPRIGLCVAALALPLLGPMSVGARQVVATRDLDCSGFASPAEAQRVLDRDPSDPYGLDGPPGPETSGEPGVACDDAAAVTQSPDAAVVVVDGPDVAIDGGALPVGTGAAGGAGGGDGGAGAGAAGGSGAVVVVAGGAGAAEGAASSGAIPTGAGAGSGDASGAAAVAVAAEPPPADLDCEHFATRADAQLVLDDDPSDPYDLDPDGDGTACNAVAAVPPPATGVVGYAVPSGVDWPIPARVGALTTPVRFAPGPGGAVVGPAMAGEPVEVLGPIQVEGRRGYVPLRTDAGVVGWIWLRYLDPASIGEAIPFAPMAAIAGSAPPAAPAAATSPAAPVAPLPPPEPVPPGITADEEAYLGTMRPVVAAMSDSMRRIGLLLQNPLPGDPTWSNRVTAQFAVWDQSAATAGALAPPESLRTVHESLVDAFGVSSREGPVIAAAIAAADTAALADSAARLAAAGAQIDAARERFDAFQAGGG